MMRRVSPLVQKTMAHALVTDASLLGLRVTRELTAIMARRGRPETIVAGRGPIADYRMEGGLHRDRRIAPP